MVELLTICIVLPLLAAIRATRGLAIGALSVTLVLLLEVLRRVLSPGLQEASGAWLMADRLNAVPMALFAAIALVTVIVAPRRDINRSFLISLLTLTSATLAAYAAANLLVFLAGWIASGVGFSLRRAPARLPLAGSILLLTAAVILIAATGASLSITSQITPHDTALQGAFALLVLAAILRELLFPFHRATVKMFHGAPILLSALLVNAHLGAFLIARIAVPMFPELAPAALPWLGGLALFTSLYTAVLGIAEREPARLLAMLLISQSSAILAGLATASHEGIAGALLQWTVLGVSATMLIAIYRCLEVRVNLPPGNSGFLGLAATMPRLAVFFAISGLTMVGLPGTLGFAGEDLLIHGVLAKYSWWGAALPVAIALNAYHVFRLFARLFLGKDITSNTAIDALPRERWAFSACLALLVWGGLAPSQAVSLQATAVSALVGAAGASSDSHR